MADETTSNESPIDELAVNFLERGAESDLKPYVTLIMEGLRRCMDLVIESQTSEKISDEILRAAVVLNHAYLEDFMRTLVLAFLPTLDEKALDGVPLAGLQSDRAEKFSLGKLVQHRGKSVDDVIKESVATHMSRSTFNSVREIMATLERIGLKLPDGTNKSASKIPELHVTDSLLISLDRVIQRRHQIVHRADKTQGKLEPITPVDVLGGIVATMTFTLCAAQTAFVTRYSYEQFRKQLEKALAEYWQAIEKGGSAEHADAADS
jgi:hypothetical protein